MERNGRRGGGGGRGRMVNNLRLKCIANHAGYLDWLVKLLVIKKSVSFI